MSTITTGYRRIRRRELHSSRSGLAITLAVVLAVLLAWIGTELVLGILNRPALLVAPADMAQSLVRVTSVPAGIAIASAVVLLIVGLALVIAAVLPGRRARHTIPDDRIAVVVDNEVIASALARHASRVAGVDPDNTTVAVAHRRAEVGLTPTSGTPVEAAAVQTAVDAQLREYRLSPAVSARVHISANGKVGA